MPRRFALAVHVRNLTSFFCAIPTPHLIVSNGGIAPGGFNWPLRGQKHTYWEGGSRAVGFVHAGAGTGLLPRTGYEYRGLMHVSDWLPTLLNLAGGDAGAVDGLDGHDVWPALAANGSSPRTELLHNIDTFGRSDFGNAALRVGSLKLIVGSPGVGDHLVPPGCNATVCPPPVPPPASAGCQPDQKNTTMWLFDIEQDPLELCNLAQARPADVARLLARLAEYNRTAVPAHYPPGDPAANPANRSGAEKNFWGPWR